ncbi:MAG: SusC/RagA family TonB-linked outer membrane protein [Muribaculaceae bacterium]|nr:SusC/RagA family TonB-linked outer membrane protein [Muribaculaceae bacterium]
MNHKSYFLPALMLLIPPVAYAGSRSENSTPASEMSVKSAETQSSSKKTMKITGTVTDDAGEALPGATVQIKGTTIGAITDVDGNFTILAKQGSSDLLVNFVGMEPFSMRITPENVGTPLKIVLSPSSTMLDQVVVTGYQTIKKENATGSSTTINAKELEKRHSADITASLEGNVPGLVVDKKNTYKTGEDQLTIRGTGTFEARTAPLVVVDGLPIEGGLNSVNMYEVANITVLKDAAATAIYGARASNGVIVITTKSANKEKISVDFNADVTVSEKLNYNKAGLASAAQLIQLERLNWAAMLADDDQSSFNTLLSNWNMGGFRAQGISQAQRLLLQNYLGEISDSELNDTFDRWSKNDYRKEWMDASQSNQVFQQYNLAIRTQGKRVNSNIIFNYSNDNLGTKNDYMRSIQFRYRGDMEVAKWLNLSFSVNVLSNRSKIYDNDTEFGSYNSFAPYLSMYNLDGSPREMEAGVILSNSAFSNPDYELADHSYNFIKDQKQNTSKEAYTNVRSYIHANFTLPVDGWTASAQFQYEDINRSSETLSSKNSYYFRNLYNLYTTVDSKTVWVDDPFWDFDDWDGNFDHMYMKPEIQDVTTHHIPYGAIKRSSKGSGAYWTFRAQTDYDHIFADVHEVHALAGFEYRDVHTKSSSDMRLGYDPQTLTNQITQTDWSFINGWGNSSILGPEYAAYGLYGSFGDSDVLHRYYSYYFTANYVYDHRYSIFGSFRVDKTDLFGTDPKFRGRPLWSISGSWNAHNEAFLRDKTWLNILKVRLSYGLTGNIDPNATSYLTASIGSNGLNGGNVGTVNTPPNDQLRWEKTATWNAGIDFGFLDYRLTGSLDFYHKKGTDLLCDVALDITTGWEKQKLNAGHMINRGFEIQLNGQILQQSKRDDVGINLGASFSYNKNKVTKVFFHPSTGAEFRQMSLKEGYPMNSMISIDYAGFQQDGKMIYGTWRDHNGEVHNTSTSSADFTIEDCIYSGTTTPVWTGSLIPEIRWNGFSLYGMLSFYGGHVMRVSPVIWSTTYGYDGKCPDSALDYWNGVEGAIPNGYQTKYLKNGAIGSADFRNVEKADYLKFRTLALSYDFDKKLIRKIGLSELRLRFQINNLCTWSRNKAGWDPEGFTVVNGTPMSYPRSYTMSLFFNI